MRYLLFFLLLHSAAIGQTVNSKNTETISDDGLDTFDSRKVDTCFWIDALMYHEWKPIRLDTLKRWLLVSHDAVGTLTNYRTRRTNTRSNSINYYRHDTFVIEGYIIYATYEQTGIDPNPTGYLDERRKPLPDVFTVWDSRRHE